MYRMPPKSKSLCKGKSVKAPNRCKKIRGCKVASGPKRTYCRKSKNKRSVKSKQTRKLSVKK